MASSATTPTNGTSGLTKVIKLPLPERVPVALAAAGTGFVDIVPVAIQPTTASPIRIAGDSSPVIFGPTAGRAVTVYKPRKGGAVLILPAAPAAAVGHNIRLDRAKSQDFAHFLQWSTDRFIPCAVGAPTPSSVATAPLPRNRSGGTLMEHHGGREGLTAIIQLQDLS